MTRAWKFVLVFVLLLFAAGVVLLGAAWLTGASLHRVIELVFDVRAGFDAWTATVLSRANTLWAGLIEQIKAFF